ncbi:unnamed protein product [Ophioblennius macclurei]
MIPMGRTLCLPDPATVHELFLVVRDAGAVPDISLDPVLTTFLSLDSSAALQHQYAYAQRSMSREQRAEFNGNLTSELGGSRVARGGVGVVALALSLLFDQVAHQVQSPADGNSSSHATKTKRIFGIGASSRIGSIIEDYLRLLPGIANDEDKVAEATELFDTWLKLELVDHFERMTTKKRMSTVSMQQWLTGAAFHLHMRIHQVRLNSVPSGSVRSLRVSYKTGFNHLIQRYTTYLRNNIRETAAPAEPGRARSRAESRQTQTSTFNMTSVNVSSSVPLNISHNLNASECCKTLVAGEDFALNNTTGRLSVDDKPESELDSSATQHVMQEEDGALLGLLVIEPLRNVSHAVHHHACQSPVIQQALVTRIVDAQDLQRNTNFFSSPEKVLQGLFRQAEDFELTAS